MRLKVSRPACLGRGQGERKPVALVTRVLLVSRRYPMGALFAFGAILLTVGLVWPSLGRAASPRNGEADGSLLTASGTPMRSIASGYGNLPLYFEANEGQSTDAVKYVSHGGGYTLFLKKDEAVLAVQKMDEHSRRKFESHKFFRSPRFRQLHKTHIVRVKPVGANSEPVIEPLEALPGKSNYLVGADPAKWRRGIATYGRVRYGNVYPGVDLEYYGNQRRLEFDFTVAPGSDPSKIRLQIESGGNLVITPDGGVRVDAGEGSLDLLKPDVYQIESGHRKPVEGRFVRFGRNQVGIRVGSFDRHKPLVIDPVLSYSTYFGGSGEDDGAAIAVDSAGNAYIAGEATSSNFPTLNGYQSSGNSNGVCFISKLDPTGKTLLYSTYLGGTGGDLCFGIGLDASNNVYVAGATLSTDFPTINGFQTSLVNPSGTAFVSRIDTTQNGQASLVYSTYLGGGGNNDNSIGDYALGLAVDWSGRAYVTGQTTSDDSTASFPTTSGAYQTSLASTNGNAFLSILDTNQTASASLAYSTYLGGGSDTFGDFGTSVAIDSLGRAYLMGVATSGSPTPFPTTPSAYQTTLNSPTSNTFVAEIDPFQSGAQSLLYSSYFGGSSTNSYGDQAGAIALDPSGFAYVIGDTTSSDFPVTSGAFQTTNSTIGKAFVAKFDLTQSGAQSLIYSTFLGGSGHDGEVGVSIAVDADGHAYAAGSTSNSDFPKTTDAYQSTLRSTTWNGYLTELNAAGSGLVYSTFLGGTCAGIGDRIGQVVLNSFGDAYVVGGTCSTNFPVVPANAYQTSLQGTRNAFVAKFIRDPDSIAISPLSPGISLGTAQQLIATATYADGSTQDISALASWTSSTPAAATVSSSGLVTSVSQGSSTIHASYGTKSAFTVATVGPPVLTALSLTPASATIAMGLSQQIVATGTYSDGSTQNITNTVSWSIVPSGLVMSGTAGLFTGVAPGTANMTASSGEVSATSTLTIGAPLLTSIVVIPEVANVRAGHAQQFIAAGIYSDGSAQDLTSTVAWTSSHTSVGTINASGLASAVATGNTTITAAQGAISGTAALNVQAGSVSLNTSRYQHSATLLDNGTLLFAGGQSCPTAGSCTYLNSAELYDPSTGAVSNTGSMSAVRSAPAVLLGSGKVLIAGGYSCDASGNCSSLSSAEVYDPDAGTFSSAGTMTAARFGHTMTLLPSGKVVIAGGENCTSATSCTALGSAEVYDPDAGTFTSTGSLNAARFNASAVALRSGQVLVAGGFDGSTYPAAAELYDPSTGTFVTTGSLNTPRTNATATLLDNGALVLIAGGTTCTSPDCPTASSELYNNGTFFYATYPTGAMSVARDNHAASLLTNGQVLLSSGYSSCTSSACVSDSTVELFDLSSGAYTAAPALATGRSGQTSTLMTDGSVLIAGGINGGVTLSSTDSYQPSSLALPNLASITLSPQNVPLAVGKTLRMLATGQDAFGNSLGTLEAVTWNSSSTSVAAVSNAAGSAGTVNARAAGTTTITASVGNISASTQVVVTPPLVSISVTPSRRAVPPVTTTPELTIFSIPAR